MQKSPVFFKPLSKSKTEYKARSATQPAETTFLTRGDLAFLLPKYEAKLGTEIYLKGNSPAAFIIMYEKESRIENKIAALKDDEKKYVTYLLDHWCCYESQFSINKLSVFSNFYDELLGELREFLDNDTKLRLNLSPEELNQINTTVKNHPFWPDIFQAKITEYIDFLTRNMKTSCTVQSKEESCQEINHILSLSESTKPIVYWFNSGSSEDVEAIEHMEQVFITKDRIIKPVTWNVPMPWRQALLPGPDKFKVPFYHLDKNLSCFLISGDKSKAPVYCPQAGGAECSTLNLVTMKELLKNGQEQLNEWTLQLSLYNNDNELCHVFIPSPQCLRYSQRSAFNEMLAKIVSDTDETHEVKHEVSEGFVFSANGSVNKKL